MGSGAPSLAFISCYAWAFQLSTRDFLIHSFYVFLTKVAHTAHASLAK
ncbi:hypothetical protein HHE02_02150 [Helicobacter heilmannii]|nr:hypothetical protein HHE02_02150 [Helicobacter heilmannii]